MGPYCKHCDSRCFIPTDKDDFVKTDLKATCLNGIKHDMSKTYPILKDSKGNNVGWLVELTRGEKYSLAACIGPGNKLMTYEVDNWELEERHDLTKFAPMFYRLTR